LANLGKKASEETKQKMSKANKGRVYSFEQREKMKAVWVVRKQKNIEAQELQRAFG
jgi:predicted Ser/Thr protein kinase